MALLEQAEAAGMKQVTAVGEDELLAAASDLARPRLEPIEGLVGHRGRVRPGAFQS
jgi:hypothetical protein